jgi:hypothetical protein
MTTDGAMQDDVDVLQKGIVNLLPDDAHGRAVLFMDRTKMCEPHASTEQIVSVLWTRRRRRRRSSALPAHFLFILLAFSDLHPLYSSAIVSDVFLRVSTHVTKGICSKARMGGLCQ